MPTTRHQAARLQRGGRVIGSLQLNLRRHAADGLTARETKEMLDAAARILSGWIDAKLNPHPEEGHDE